MTSEGICEVEEIISNKISRRIPETYRVPTKN